MEVLEDLKKDLEALLTSKLDEFRDEMKRAQNVPQNDNKLNVGHISQEISSNLSAHLNSLKIKTDDSAIISVLREQQKDIWARISGIAQNNYDSIHQIRNEKREAIRVKFQDSFFGFSNWKAFAIYISFVVGLGAFSAWSFFHNSTDAKIIDCEKRMKAINEAVAEFSKKNPKLAQKYFYDKKY